MGEQFTVVNKLPAQELTGYANMSSYAGATMSRLSAHANPSLREEHRLSLDPGTDEQTNPFRLDLNQMYNLPQSKMYITRDIHAFRNVMPKWRVVFLLLIPLALVLDLLVYVTALLIVVPLSYSNPLRLGIREAWNRTAFYVRITFDVVGRLFIQKI